MRFSDLLPGAAPKKRVGRVIEAEWDESERGVRFTIRFEPSGRRFSGICRSGNDPVSGAFVSEADLKARLSEFLDLKVYENPISGDPNTLSPEDFREMTIELSLANLNVRYNSGVPKRTANSFISRIFR